MMKAILIKDFGEANQLYIGDTEKPVPADNELLVKVEAAGINRADIFQRMGKYPPPKGASEILGLELAGRVEEAGEKAGNYQKGDKVFGLVPGGAYAEYALIDQNMAMPVPASFTFTRAAAIPEVFLTAYQALQWHGELKMNEKVLIHAGGSGVGTAAIQLVKAMGSECIITASAGKHEHCLKLGAQKAIDYNKQDFADVINQYTNGEGVDLIIDFIGAPYFKKNLESLSRDGRLVILATLGGGKVDEFDVRKLLVKRLQITGSTLRSRSAEYQAELTAEFWNFAKAAFEKGTIRPVIDKVFDWREAKLAHEYMEANKNTGKVILEVNTS